LAAEKAFATERTKEVLPGWLDFSLRAL